MVSSLILLRSLRVYILKQLFFSISVNSGFGNIYLAAFAAWQIFSHYSPRFQRIIVKCSLIGITQANWGGPVLRGETSGKNNIWLGNPLFFLCLPSNVFPDIGSVGWIEKQKTWKKNHKKSWNSRPWYPRTMLKVSIHIFGLKKCTIYCEKCSCFCSCFSLCCYYAHFSD